MTIVLLDAMGSRLLPEGRARDVDQDRDPGSVPLPTRPVEHAGQPLMRPRGESTMVGVQAMEKVSSLLGPESRPSCVKARVDEDGHIHAPRITLQEFRADEESLEIE